MAIKPPSRAYYKYPLGFLPLEVFENLFAQYVAMAALVSKDDDDITPAYILLHGAQSWAMCRSIWVTRCTSERTFTSPDVMLFTQNGRHLYICVWILSINEFDTVLDIYNILSSVLLAFMFPFVLYCYRISAPLLSYSIILASYRIVLW